MSGSSSAIFLSALLGLGNAPLGPPVLGPSLVAAARTQIGITRTYDARYARIPYPGGDVPLDRGVCTDVLIRAFRTRGIDLQKLVHEDMKRAWEAYPRSWGLKAPDRNIDHRRVPNLATFFTRHGQSLPIGPDPAGFLPGDIVTWRLASGVPHTGLTSDRRTASGTPLVIHNIGMGTQEEDRLFAYPLTGHFRYAGGLSGSGVHAAPASRAE